MQANTRLSINHPAKLNVNEAITIIEPGKNRGGYWAVENVVT